MFEEPAKLNLLVGTRCNNACLFCLDRGGEAVGQAQALSLDDAVAAMRADRADGGTWVAYGRLEAALDRGFEDIVRAAREQGYEHQHLTSNGRVLRNRALLERFVEAGIDCVTVSIHAPRAEVHDALSNRPRAFEQTVGGIENLVAVRKKRPLRLAFGVTLTALNLPLLSEHYAFLQRFTPAYIGLNSLLYSGRALDNAARLSFSYTALEATLLDLLASHRNRLFTRIALLGVPFCALSRLPPELVGLREAFRMPSMTSGREHDDGERFYETGAAGESGFAIEKLKVCRECAMRAECPGVSRGYLENHGAGEFAALGEDYRRRAMERESLFPTDRYRYPLSSPAETLSQGEQRRARALGHAAAPEWRLAGVKAFGDERQVGHKLVARYESVSRHRPVVLEVAPREPDSHYFATAGSLGLTLGDTGELRLSEPEAKAREALIARLIRLLRRLA